MGTSGRAALVAVAIIASHHGSPWARVSSESNELRAPQRLVETGLYASDRPGVIAGRHRPFSPQYPLWSDGAAKARWVYLPDASSIDATDPGAWNFPVGTRFWKEFT